MSHPAVAVVGAHHTPLVRRQEHQSLEEMVLAAAQGALSDAGLLLGDIDGIVLSTADQVQGRVIESMVTNGAAGGVGRDVTTLASAGEHALVYGYLRLRACQGRRLLVLSWGKASESVDPEHAELVAAEPFLLRPLGMRATVAAGLQASSYAARFGLDPQAVGAVRSARAQAASAAGLPSPGTTSDQTSDLVAWPLTVGDLPAPADVAAALVVASEDALEDDCPAAWIRGIGWSTERYDLGERDLSRFEALENAANRAFADGPAAAEADVVEVQEISTVASFASCEALGLSVAGEGAAAATADMPAVNPSGGNLPANPANAAGFMRLLSAAQQARGRAGAAQVDAANGNLTAVGATLHGFSGQGASVTVFTAQREAA